MNRNRKSLIKILAITNIFLLIIAILMGIIAFNSNNSNRPPTSVEITYWGLWESAEVMHPLIEKYEADNPGVRILYSEQTFKNYESRVYTRLEQATSSSEPAPDIIRIHNSWLPKYQKYLRPLPENIMSREIYSQEFYPSALDDLTARDGQIYAIPLQIDGLMVIYNKRLLAQAGYSEPPKDWDSFIELAQKLTTKDETGKILQSGLAIGTAKNITHSVDILSYFMLQNRVEIMNRDRNTIDLTSDRAISALDTYTSFVKSQNATWATYLANDLTTFQKGELAMMFGTTRRAFDVLEVAPNIDFGLAQLPILPNNEEVYFSTYWADAVSKTSKNPEEAWKFIQFLSEPEQQRRLFQNASKSKHFGYPYSRVSMNNELTENPYTLAISHMAPYMKSWQVGEQSFVEELLKEAITAVVENNQDSRSVLSRIEKDINDQLAVSNN